MLKVTALPPFAPVIGPPNPLFAPGEICPCPATRARVDVKIETAGPASSSVSLAKVCPEFDASRSTGIDDHHEDAISDECIVSLTCIGKISCDSSSAKRSENSGS